jgi:RNA polymerase sporulation-specific sigma factor
MRFCQEKTQAQVAEVFNMTQVQVSRLEKKILLRLRNEMSG